MLLQLRAVLSTLLVDSDLVMVSPAAVAGLRSL
jgi:hypothetical protein